MLSDCLEINSAVASLFSGNSNFDKEEINKSDVTPLITQDLLNEIITTGRISIKKISEETHISIGALHRIKSGATKFPNNKTFVKLFNLYCRVCH